MKYQGKEDDFQISCMNYLRKYRSDLFAIHVPNEGIKAIGNKAIIYGAKRKAKGVVSGCPDILIFNRITVFKPNETKAGYISGLAIELKVEGGKLSESQKIFHHKLRILGWAVEVCWSIDEFTKAIDLFYPKK